MIKARIGFFALLFTAILVSCDLLSDLTKKTDTLDEDSFYAQNMINGQYYEVKAEVRYEGRKCVIWAEKGSGVTLNQARAFANEYDTIIRPRIVETFSKKNFSVNEGGTSYSFDDMVDYANWLAGRDDRKLTILLLDIKDGFRNPGSDSYVAGYFFSGNFRPKGKISGTAHYSNGRDMIYIDTYPGLTMKPEQSYATFAHELQHLINFVTGAQMNRRYAMETWVDEGLSSQAEYLYLGLNPQDKCEWFSDDEAGTIAKGNNFFVWDNHSEPLAILDEYATVYLFFRWLYLQASEELQSHIFYDIETSNYYNYRAVTNTAQQINPAWDNWETLLRTWLAANYYPQNAEYGYKGDTYLQTGDGKDFSGIKVNPIGDSSILLYPGEGVYSIIKNSFSPVTTTANIRYAGLTDNEADINTSSPYKGDTLLTFNANTNNVAVRETGYLTGVSPPPPPASRMAGKFNGPYVMDARDTLKRITR